MKRVFIAGATGYLGRHLCAEYQQRGWYVIALVRKTAQVAPIAADQLVEAQATDPLTLRGIMAGADLVVSCLGITRKSDGLSYWDVDYQANLNLLHEAERAGVGRFGYIHVLGASDMTQVPMVAAKSAFVEELQGSSVVATVIAPTGYFSDMGDFLKMAQSGRVWLFGDGSKRINPIHAVDLATATAEALEAGLEWLDVGGPDIFTQREVAELAFAQYWDAAADHTAAGRHTTDWPARFAVRYAPPHQRACSLFSQCIGARHGRGLPRHAQPERSF